MTCEINNSTINYNIIGSGINILMIHGFAVDHKLMMGCMEAVPGIANFRRIYIDLPGMGLSEASDEINSSDDVLNLLVTFIASVLGDEKFIVIGESYGGYLTRAIYSRLPEQVLGLGMICPVIIADKSKRTLPEHNIVSSDEIFLQTLGEEDAQNFAEYNVMLNEYTYNRYHEEVMSGIRLANRKVLSRIEKNYSLEADIDHHSTKVDIPVLLLTGRQDHIVGYEDAYNILDRYNRVTYLVLDGAGHNLQIEQVAVFNILTSNWLNHFHRGSHE